MTREELIRNLKHTMEKHKNDNVPTFGTNISLMCKDVLDYLEQKPCEDCISRQAVFDTLDTADKFLDEDRTVENYKALLKESFDVLPSVNPQESKIGQGHWIEVIDDVDSFGNKFWHHKCSICGNTNSGWGEYNYCSNCGAKMESEVLE